MATTDPNAGRYVTTRTGTIHTAGCSAARGAIPWLWADGRTADDICAALEATGRPFCRRCCHGLEAQRGREA